MRISIEHSLSLSVAPGTAQSVMHLMLTPPGGPTQQVESWSVEVTGIGNAGRFTDAYGNMVHLVNQARPEGDIALVARGVVNTSDANGVLGRPAGEPVPALYKRLTAATKAPVTAYGKFRNAKETRLEVLHALMARVGETLGMPENSGGQSQMMADGSQSQNQGSADAALPHAADYAHLFIGSARALDIPARFVCGYLAAGDGQPGGLHCWAEAFDDGLGWIGFDARYQLCPTERYVRLVVGLDSDSAAPLRAVPAGEIRQDAVVRAG